MVLIATALATWVVVVTAPETPIGRTLRHHLVVRLAARLDRITRGQIALTTVVLVATLLAIWFGGGDGARMAGMAMPDAAMWLASAELTAYLDVTVATITTWLALRGRGWGIAARMRVVVGKARLRRSRDVRTARRRTPVADNDDGEARPHRSVA